MRKVLFVLATSLLLTVGLQTTAFAQWGPRPMSNSEFSVLYQTAKDATFSSDQAAVIQSAIQGGNLLTCSQVIQLIALPSFDSDKLNVAVAAYDAVVDPQNWYTVYGAFTFDSDKEKLKSMTDGARPSRMANAGPRPGYMPPPPPRTRPAMGFGNRPMTPPGHFGGPRHMTDAEFSNLYSAVKDATFSSNQSELIISAVNSGNVLTVSQAVSLLKLITNDDYKLDPAVAIYNHIYDRQNWYQIYEAFTFQSTKDQLRARTQ